MNDAETDPTHDATNRQPAVIPPHAGAFVAGHRAAIEWAQRVSRDPVRRLAIARRIAREANTTTRLH